MEVLIVDGYNIINAWPQLAKIAKDDFEGARYKLIEILGNYQGYKKNRVIIVFDAHMVKGSMEKHELFENIEIVFTKENETADNYIEKFTHKFGRSTRIRVATSDYLEQTIVLSQGAIRISARELLEEVTNTENSIKKKYIKKKVKSNTIGSRIDNETLKVLEKLRRRKF